MSLKLTLNRLQQLEPLVLGVLISAMWYPSPIRDRLVWIFVLLIPILVTRWLLYHRIWTITKLDIIWLIWFGIGVANIYVAPYTRGYIILVRPFLGLIIYLTIIEAARQQRRIDKIFYCITVLAIILGTLSLFGTEWNEKSFQFKPFLNMLPTLKILPLPPDTGLSFNANEIAGAIVYLLPVVAGMGVYYWRVKRPRIGVTLAFGLLFLALFLGQSRLAIIGVLLSLALIIYLLIPRGRWRTIGWVALAAIMVLELVIIFNPASRLELAERDEDSFSGRLNIWSSALSIVRDYPLTGVGMNMFRDTRVLTKYPVPRWYPSPGATRILPHTHNELLQMGTDMGISGLILFIVIHAVAIMIAVQTWRRGDEYARAVSISAVAGILAHAVFGLGDAITFWDRFAFLFWVVFGILRAQHLLTTSFNENP